MAMYYYPNTKILTPAGEARYFFLMCRKYRDFLRKLSDQVIEELPQEGWLEDQIKTILEDYDDVDL